MEKQTRQIVITALVLLILGIILGAFGAHGLKGKVTPEKIVSFETGVRYQMYNAIALLALAGVSRVIDFPLKGVLIFVLIGVIFFSGSIYGLTIQDIAGWNLSKILGPITPVGGGLMIIGWTILLVRILRMQKSNI